MHTAYIQYPIAFINPQTAPFPQLSKPITPPPALKSTSSRRSSATTTAAAAGTAGAPVAAAAAAMKRMKQLEALLSHARRRYFLSLLSLSVMYIALLFLVEPLFISRILLPPSAAGSGGGAGGGGGGGGGFMPRPLPLDISEDTATKFSPARPSYRHSPIVSGLVFQESNATHSFSDLHESAGHAWEIGRKMFEQLQSAPPSSSVPFDNGTEADGGVSCPPSVVMSGEEMEQAGRVMIIPCGLALGSRITLVGKPRRAHRDSSPKIAQLKEGEDSVLVSQFMMELQGLKTVDGEEPPKILHFNPRLKGDWSGRPVIEQNTCYRMQWGVSQRCEGIRSPPEEETVDGLVKCEEWNWDDDEKLNASRKGRVDSMYPFVEEKLFALTLTAGVEGYHVAVDGRLVTSFPYHPGFVLEEATGLALNGDIDIQSVFAASLPSSHPRNSPQMSLEMLPHLQVPPLPDGGVDLFIGVLSAGNHFAERMGVRKSWMSSVRNSSNMVARFFVALHGRSEVNTELKKEAEYFGDIVIVPYMDSYDLVVLKTVAICEFGVHTVAAKYVMKCDDDTFVRADTLVKELKKASINRSIYVGNMNYYHKPLRSGKWAVTFEEWSEKEYPPYANGPGYILSSNIARFIVLKFENHTLRLFKMEDVSMGIWVGQFNETTPVDYIHSRRFCQFGCINGYYTAHYQSPRQMMCLWDKLKAGRPRCCNMR